MKTLLSLVLLSTLVASQASWAGKSYKHNRSQHDYAKVVSSEPIYQSVRYSEPYEECHIEQYHVRESGSQTGVVLGSIIGGVIGHELGHNKSNKKVGAVAGAVLGGAIAKDMQNHKGERRIRNERVCTVSEQTHYRQEITGYNVTYMYRGRIYHTVMEEQPGKRIPVEVNVRPAFHL